MQKNRYVRRAKISEAKFRQFLRYFSLDLEATKIAVLAGLNRNTVNRLAKLVRRSLAEQSERDAQKVVRQYDQESDRPPAAYSVRSFRDREVIAWLFPGDHVHIRLFDGEIPAESRTSQAFKRPDSIPSNGNADSHATVKLATGRRGSNLSERPAAPAGTKLLDYFWSHTQLRLAKFKGTSRRTFELHLKECEFRFNHRREDLYPILLRLMRRQSPFPGRRPD